MACFLSVRIKLLITLRNHSPCSKIEWKSNVDVARQVKFQAIEMIISVAQILIAFWTLTMDQIKEKIKTYLQGV